MAIEVDYQAWETWQQAEHHEDEAVNQYAKKNPHQFMVHGAKFRAKNAYLVAYVYYSSNKEAARIYEFFAETETVPISKMLKTVFLPENKFSIAAYDIDAETSEKLHDLFSALPEPMYGSKEYRVETDLHFSYDIHLPRYNDKIFNWGHDYRNFLQYKDPGFNATIAEIMSICRSYQ